MEKMFELLEKVGEVQIKTQVKEDTHVKEEI